MARWRCEPNCQLPHHARKHDKEITCAECGETFLAARIDARYCSPDCRLTAYRREHREQLRERARRWQAANRERTREAQRRYDERHGERVRAEKRQRYEEVSADPERAAKRREYNRRYYQENSERLRANARERQKRLGLRSNRSNDWAPMFDSLWEAQDGRCYLCDDALNLNGNREVHLDHDHACCGPERFCEKCRRGLACKWCNLIIGWAREEPERLRHIADNLEAMIAVVRARMAQ